MKKVNTKARFEYTISDTYEAGILLTGAEVKAIRAGRFNLSGSFVRILNGEAYLVNAEIPQYQSLQQSDYDSRRTRKLLLHKNQLISLETKLAQQRLTLVPVSWYTSHGLVKLEIGLAKRKKERDQREEIKKRDLEREVERVMRGKK